MKPSILFFRLILGVFATGVCQCSFARVPEPDEKVDFECKFFAFCFDTHDSVKRDLPQQAEMLKRLGFDGAGHVGLDNLQSRAASLDSVGLKLFLAGINVDLSKDTDPQLGQLRQVLPLLKDRNAILYVVLTGLPPEDARGDTIAIPLLRTIADLAKESSTRIGIYPHTGDWVTRIDHAVSVAKQVDRSNCGVIFNLCHWLRNEDHAKLNRSLAAARPHLVAVTINGAEPSRKADKTWKSLIRPLGKGSFKTDELLRALRDLDYRGPIGLMCWGIGGDANDHLTQSMKAWRKLRPVPSKRD